MLKCAWGTFGTANPGKLGGRAASHKRYPLNLPPSMRSELICRHCAVTGSGISSPATAPAGTTTSVESPYHTRPAPKHPTVPTSRPPDGRLQAGAVSLGARLEIQRISRYIEFQGTTRQRRNGEIEAQNMLTAAIERASSAGPLDPTKTIPSSQNRDSLIGGSVQLAFIRYAAHGR